MNNTNKQAITGNDFNLYLIKKKAANAIAVPMISVRYTQIRQGRANSIV